MHAGSSSSEYEEEEEFGNVLVVPPKRNDELNAPSFSVACDFYLHVAKCI